MIDSSHNATRLRAFREIRWQQQLHERTHNKLRGEFDKQYNDGWDEAMRIIRYYLKEYIFDEQEQLRSLYGVGFKR